MPPRNARGFVDVTLDDGSQVTGELANNSKITAQVTTYTLPRVQRARVDVGAGDRAPYPKLGRLQPMSFSMAAISVYASLLAGIDKVYTIEVVETLVNESGTNPTLTHEITGKLMDTDFGAVNLGADEVRPVTYNYVVTKYKQTKSDVTAPIYDIDLDADIYKQNGDEMFPA